MNGRRDTVAEYVSNGGGATHIAKRTGQLKDLSSYTSDILIVSGGGGGGLLVDTTEYTGKDAGGISGSGDNSADQSTGNAFGQGESGTNLSGGGSGLYGGYKGTSSKSGGAGSGYIGNSFLSNKKMVGFNVPTSSAEGTKTESVSVFDSNYVANKPKAGNGHARIKILKERIEKNIFSNGTFEQDVVVSGYNLLTYKILTGSGSDTPSINLLSEYFCTSYGLMTGQRYMETFYIEDNYIRKAGTKGQSLSPTGKRIGETGTFLYIPLKRIYNPIKISAKIKTIQDNGYSGTDWNVYTIGVGAVGVITENQMRYIATPYLKFQDWTDYELEISQLPYVDYFVLNAFDGSPAFKDLKIIYDK